MDSQTINDYSRRDFVKDSSILGASLLVTPLLSKANFFSGPDDVIKVAIIGCGGRGTGAAMQACSTRQNVKLVAMADAFRDRLDQCYDSLTSDESTIKNRIDVPEERKYVGLDAYKKAIVHADVVILTTPPGFRPMQFEEAVNRGKHVFMEKPVATDPAGIRKVLEAAEIAQKKKLNVVVGLQRHYQNSYRALYKNKHLIGDITSAQCWWNNDGVWVHHRAAGETEMEYQIRNWYYFTWICGDHIVEQHIHNIAMVNWFKGAYPVKAQGMGGRQIRVGKEYGQIFDHHYVEFTYADGSILNSQCRHMPGTMSKVDELLIGTKGKIYGDAGIIKDTKGKELFRFDMKKQNNPYQTEHDELFEAVAKGQYKFADAGKAAKSNMTSIMGRMATYSGQIIEWDKALNLPGNPLPTNLDFNSLPPVLPNADGFYPIPMPGVTKFF